MLKFKVPCLSAPNLKKGQSSNLCYLGLGLYHRQSILSFFTLYVKDMYPISMYSGMLIQCQP